MVCWFQDVETEDSSDTSMFYFCHGKDTLCNGQSLRTRSLCLAVLYQFFRETACDTRDIAEDTKDGMKTLPVRLGKRSMLLVMAGVGTLLDSLITNAILVTWLGIQVHEHSTSRFKCGSTSHGGKLLFKICVH
ncbi:hypothetical protein DL768_011613 [Monosporascus sp. mg162]|nr:hypothetical protein DL768_011613 [Monosporascus sp. mg162]